MSEVITIETTADRPIEIVRETWNEPKHMVHWGFASDDWQSILNHFKKYTETV